MNAMNKEIDGWVRVFEVIEPQRHRKGFTVYKVISRVFHNNSSEGKGITEIISFKRFSEFKKLHKSLSHLHTSLHLKGVFPPFPDSKLFGRFDAQVIESRRQSALELLEFAAKHPPLLTSNVFVTFFENSVTNFTTLSTHDIIDSPTHDVNQLPQPIEPNLSPSDDWSQRSGDNGSDGSSYYSTPIHSMDSCVNEQNLVNSKAKHLTEFDPLAKTNDTSGDSAQELKDNEWFIYAIQSCDNETKESTQSVITFSDREDEKTIPEPFAETKTNSNETNDIKVITSDVFVNQLSITCDPNNTTIEEKVVSKDVSNPTLTSNAINNQSLGTNDTYLLDAAIILKQAQQHEEVCEWEPAFESLKCAVGILLQGVVEETDSEKKASIRRKTFQYLTRAEHIYDTYLSQTNSFQPSRRWAPDSPFKSLNASLVQSWFGSSQELTKFKVIGLKANKVQIVVDTTTNNIFIIKVIYKSSLSLETNSSTNQLLTTHTNPLLLAQSIFPNDIPFMAQIYRIFKTEYALFLLLEYSKGELLWDRISDNSNGGNNFSPCPDCTFAFDDKDSELIANNAYSGRRLSRTRSECGANAFETNNRNSIYDTISERHVFRKSESMETYSPSGSLASIESIDCDMPSKSYLSLCNDFAFSQQKCSENSVIANCKLGYISDSNDSIDSITECDSKSYIPYQLSNRNHSSSQSKRHASTESLGITGLLAKAKNILKNVDQTLNLTKYMTKNTNFRTNRSNDLHEFESKSLNISEVFHQMDDNSNCFDSNRPQVSEDEARVWLSQIVRCLQHLHKLGIIYCDLKPENLMLTENNNICISYKCFWNESPLHLIDEKARERLYVAPELIKSGKINHMCDWWTFGVLAFELLTSRSLVSYYPNGITSHTTLYFPVFISLEAKDLINKLLVPNPTERLGRHGSEEITTHPFFEGINWNNS